MASTLGTATIPKLWSARMLLKFYARAYWRTTMTDVSSQIPYGSKLEIPIYSRVPTIGDYTVNTDIAAAQTATTANNELVLDKQKYFHLYLDDIELRQTRGDLMNRTSERAMAEMAIQVDKDMFASMTNATTIPDANELTLDSGSTTDSTYSTEDELKVVQQFANIKAKMDKVFVPATGRWAVVNNRVHNMLVQWFASTGNSNFVNRTGYAATDQAITSGTLPDVFGFRIIQDQRIPDGINGGTVMAVFGHPDAAHCGFQINGVEMYRPPLRFGYAMKGLMNYGFKVSFPEYIWTLKEKA